MVGLNTHIFLNGKSYFISVSYLNFKKCYRVWENGIPIKNYIRMKNALKFIKSLNS
jgi:hypothetical protein